jgi:hypothetical protein
MPKLCIFAAVFLFWSALAASLMQVQLAASPVHKMRVAGPRTVAVRAVVPAQQSAAPAVACN